MKTTLLGTAVAALIISGYLFLIKWYEDAAIGLVMAGILYLCYCVYGSWDNGPENKQETTK